MIARLSGLQSEIVFLGTTEPLGVSTLFGGSPRPWQDFCSKEEALSRVVPT
jgi:hypothetical protein